jgi:hypothetical protein
MNTESNKDKIIIPDQLNITINTGIPGLKKIKFNPSMINKGSYGKQLMFNPMIKLNENIISKIPQEYRTKYFFDKNSFQSLLNKMKEKPATSLLQASRQGYVDNNIKVTLDTLFPVNSVIYISNRPYSISDIQWTTSDWKIETKQGNKTSHPYNQLVKEEIISGQKQLKELPSSVLVGKNYAGQPVVASGIGKPTTSSSSSSKTGSYSQNISNAKPVTVNSDFFTIPKDIRNQVLSPQNEYLFDAFKNNLQENTNETKFLFNYFSKKDFFMLIQNICFNLPENIRMNINNFYSFITNTTPKKTSDLLNPKLYITACQNTSVLFSPPDGNCFFKAVSDGINIYNYENQNKKIVYNNYGNTQLFTISVLRDIVYRYIQSLDQDVIDTMLMVSGSQLDELNETFKDAVDSLKSLHGGSITNEQYITELNTVYNMYPNFLVYKPPSVPVNIDEYDSPFRVLKHSEIERYIKSKNYWANNIAIEAVCSLLNICVIPIEKYDTALGVSNKNVLKSLFTDNELISSSCSKKRMFLLFHGNHYELIRFKYLIKPINNINTEKWYTIFENNNLIPPINILLLIFGSAYINLDIHSRPQFSIYQSILQIFESSVRRIFQTCYGNSQELQKFNHTFNMYFPNTRTITENLGIINFLSSCTSRKKNILGGYGYNYPPPQPQYGYNYPQPPPYRNNYPQPPPYRNNYPQPPPYGYNYPQPQYNYPQKPYRNNYPQPQYNYPYQKPYGYNYPPYGYNYPQYGYNKNKNIQENQLAYAINIDMELYPGKSLTDEQLKNSKCHSKYNAVRKAYSEFTGRPYKIPSVYNKTIKNNNTQPRGGNRKTLKNMD